MSRPVACTIVSNNYLAFARVLADSFSAHHPEIDFHVLIVDEPATAIDYEEESFRVTFAGELDIPSFSHFAFKYSLIELNTAVKPYFLEHLHRHQGATGALYFDPDIKVFANLEPLLEGLERHALLLTPHLLAPLEDDARPSERNILMSGVFNLGFLGIRFDDETLRFLDWWQRRLYSYCLHRIADGLFVDQRWMDLAPCLLDEVEILRDPGYNVAYWNLAHRRLGRGESGWQVNQEVPLRFFHFSGLVIDDLEQLSKYQDRYRLADRPDLRPVFEEYQRDVLAAGWEQTRDTDYGYGRFRNGRAIPELARTEIWQLDDSGERWEDPFAVDGPDSYHAWLTARVEGDDGEAWLPRMALVLWDHRPDLQGAFPHPLGNDHRNFVRWLLSDEPRAAGVDAEFLRQLETVDLDAAETAVEQVSAEPALEFLSAAPHHDSRARPVLPRIAMLIWEKRPDLQEAFRAPLGVSRDAFARWLVTFARVEYQLPPELWLPTLDSLPWSERLRARAWWLWRRSRGKTIDIRGSWRDFGPQT